MPPPCRRHDRRHGLVLRCVGRRASAGARWPVRSRLPKRPAAGRALTLLRLEGVAPSVAHRQAALTEIVKPFGEVGLLAEPASRPLWRAIRDVQPFAASRTGAEAAALAHLHARRRAAPVAAWSPPGPAPLHLPTGPARSSTLWLYDWAGGLIWLDLGAATMPARPWCARAVAACGGHATLIRAPAAVRAAVEAFEPQDAGLAALTKRVKEGFDPKGVFNPAGCGRACSSMQTSFTLAQLADPNVAESEKILRTCVHCGFCTATCPTYVLLGDELDSPRGRIYLIKEMLEHDAPATRGRGEAYRPLPVLPRPA